MVAPTLFSRPALALVGSLLAGCATAPAGPPPYQEILHIAGASDPPVEPDLLLAEWYDFAYPYRPYYGGPGFYLAGGIGFFSGRPFVFHSRHVGFAHRAGFHHHHHGRRR